MVVSETENQSVMASNNPQIDMLTDTCIVLVSGTRKLNVIASK